MVRLVYFHASLLNGYCSKARMIYMGMPYIFWKLLICCIWSSNNLKFFRNNLVLKLMKNHCFWRLERSKINRKSHFSQNWLVKHHISVTSIERGDKELSNEVWQAYPTSPRKHVFRTFSIVFLVWKNHVKRSINWHKTYILHPFLHGIEILVRNIP